MRLLPRIVFCVLLLSGRLPAADASAPLQRLSVVSIEDSMMERAEKIILPRVEFKGVSHEEALEFLRKEIRERDPSGGVRFDIRYEPVKSGPPEAQGPVIPGLDDEKPTGAAPSGIIMSVTDIPASEALRYVTGLAGIQLEVIRGAVFLAKLKTRTFPFVFNDPALCEELGIDPTIAAEIRKDVKQYLDEAGIAFHPGTACQVFAGGKSLFVKHTEEDLDAVQHELERVIPVPVPGPDFAKFPQKAKRAAMRQRAERLILSEVSFVDVSLIEAADRLTELSRLWDVTAPSLESRGIKVLAWDGDIVGISEEPIPDDTSLSERRIRYAAKKVPLLEAVQAVAEQFGKMVSIESNWLVIREKLAEELMGAGSFFVPKGISAPESLWQLLQASSSNIAEFSAGAPVTLSPKPLMVRETKVPLQAIESEIEEWWRNYYASEQWTKEQKRQQRLRELGIYRERFSHTKESLP